MESANERRLALATNSDKLKPHRRLLIVRTERETNRSQGRSPSPSFPEGVNFISSRHIPIKSKLTANTNSEQSRHSQGNKSLDREYHRMMSQSTGRNKKRTQIGHQAPQPKNIRAAPFLTRILDRGGRSSQLRRSLAEDGNWRDSIILELNRNQGFVPVAKAKKASFFEVVGKKDPKANQEEISKFRTTRAKRQFDEYLTFIGAGPEEQLGPTPTFQHLRLSSKPELLPNRKIIAAILRLVQLTNRALLAQQEDLQHRHRFIVQYSHLYFTLIEKSELQVILSCSLLQGFRNRLREVFLLTRAFMLTVLMLALERRLFSKTVEKIPKLHHFCLMLEQCYGVLQQVVIEMKEVSSTTSDTAFTLSFKILRGMYSMEKNCDEMKQLSKEMHPTQLLSNKASLDIERHFTYVMQRGLNSSTFQQRLLKSEMILAWRYMRIPPTPYLPLPIKPSQITVVLGLEMTLVWDDAGVCMIRPRVQEFITAYGEHFEFVVFSTNLKPVADRLIQHIDPKGTFFRYRLYRQHMSISEGKPYKDLTKLGREMSRLLAVDDCSDHLRYNPQNGITIHRFEGDPNDCNITLLSDALSTLLAKKPADVRQHLRKQQSTLSYIPQGSQQSISSLRQQPVPHRRKS